jgi:hypothetical protein
VARRKRKQPSYKQPQGYDSSFMVVPPLLITNRRKAILSFDFLTLPLFTIDAEMYVEQHRTCMYPL